MKKNLYLALLASSPLVGEMCCIPLDNPTCYPYAVNPPLSNGTCYNFGARIDYLYWRPYVDDNAFATVSNQAQTVGFPINSTPPAYSDHSVDYKYDWDSGFRIGLDAGIPCNEWRVSLDWTHFQSHSKGFIGTSGRGTYASTAYINDPLFVSGTAPNQGTTIYDSSVVAKWKINYEAVDLLFGREFYVGHQVTFAPYGGLRYLYVRQTATAAAAVDYALLVDVLFPYSSSMSADLKADFKGVGIVGGFTSAWEMFSQFSLYGDVSSSICYGRGNSELRGTLNSIGYHVVTPSTSYFAERNVDTLRATLDLGFGLEWRQQVFADSSYFVVRAGWEEHLLFRQNNFLQSNIIYQALTPNTQIITQKLTDLSFQGLVVSLAYNF